MSGSSEGASTKISGYAWVVLIVLFLTNTLLSIAIFQIGGLAGLLIEQVGLDGSQIAMVLSVPMLASAIFGIPVGALADRFGVKQVVVAGLVVSTIGAVARISADNFWMLFLWMFLLGVGMACTNSNAAKLAGAWFPPERIGFAMGVFVAASGCGSTIALATTPLFGSIQGAFTFSAVGIGVLLVLWLTVVRNKPADAPEMPVMPMGKSFAVAARNKYIWIGGVALFFMMGTYVTHAGFLSNGLVVGKGADPVSAGLVASCVTFSFIFGGIIGPILAQRVGRIKPFLGPTGVICAVVSYLSWMVAFGPLTWVFLILTGLFLGMSVPIIMSLPMSLPDIGPAYAGSAGGILSTWQMAGSFFLSSYVITPLAGDSMDVLFLIISIGYLVYGAVMFFLPELGAKAK